MTRRYLLDPTVWKVTRACARTYYLTRYTNKLIMEERAPRFRHVNETDSPPHRMELEDC